MDFPECSLKKTVKAFYQKIPKVANHIAGRVIGNDEKKKTAVEFLLLFCCLFGLAAVCGMR
jgi:hypothetical protein